MKRRLQHCMAIASIVILSASAIWAAGSATVDVTREPLTTCEMLLPGTADACAPSAATREENLAQAVPASTLESTYEPGVGHYVEIELTTEFNGWTSDPDYALLPARDHETAVLSLPPGTGRWPLAENLSFSDSSGRIAYDGVGESGPSSRLPIISPYEAIILGCLSTALVAWSRRRRAM